MLCGDWRDTGRVYSLVDDAMKRLDEILARCEAATPGPWESTSSLPVYAVSGPTYDVVSATGREYRRRFGWHGCEFEDAEFISHSRTDLPLVVQALKKAVAMLQYTIGPTRDVKTQKILDTLAEIEKILGDGK